MDENYREPVDRKFADDTERILKLIGAQNAGNDDDEDMKMINNRTEYLVH